MSDSLLIMLLNCEKERDVKIAPITWGKNRESETKREKERERKRERERKKERERERESERKTEGKTGSV